MNFIASIKREIIKTCKEKESLYTILPFVIYVALGAGFVLGIVATFLTTIFYEGVISKMPS